MKSLLLTALCLFLIAVVGCSSEAEKKANIVPSEDPLAEVEDKILEAYPTDYKPEGIIKYDGTGLPEYWTKFDEKFLSYHPDLKQLPPDFFMQSYDVNWMCSSLIESYQRLQKCDFSLQCEINADFYFEKWCMREVAVLTMNESWCDNIRINVDWDCYQRMAMEKLDEKICWNIKGGDNPVVDCITNIANLKKNASICNDIDEWYKQQLQEHDKNASLSANLSSDRIKECKEEALKCKESPEKYIKGCDDEGTLLPAAELENKKRLLDGTMIEKLHLGTSKLEDCEVFSQKQKELFSGNEGKVLNPDFLRMLCISQIENCSGPNWEARRYDTDYDTKSCQSRKLEDIDSCASLEGFPQACWIIIGMKDLGVPKANSNMFYVLGWGIANDDINQCITSRFAVDGCLASTAVMWLDCEACNHTSDENLATQCKEAVKDYSNGKVNCE